VPGRVEHLELGGKSRRNPSDWRFWCGKWGLFHTICGAFGGLSAAFQHVFGTAYQF